MSEGKTLGDEAAEYWQLVAEKAELSAKLEAIKTTLNAKEETLVNLMDSQGLELFGTGAGSIRVGETIVPSVDDWDSFYAFIHRHKYYHLLDRRPNSASCRELFETKGSIPGVKPFKRRGIRRSKA